MKKLIVAIVCAALGATTSGLQAQSGSIRLVAPPPAGVKFAQPWRPAGPGGGTKVIGSVIDITQVPVAHVKVQMRNLVTGAVDLSVESDENGEYEFEGAEPGTYIVEMVMADGSTVALSNAGTLSRYETMRTTVQLPGRWNAQLRSVTVSQSSASFIGISAQSTMSAATLRLAANVNIAPTNSGEPVSATTQRQ